MVLHCSDILRTTERKNGLPQTIVQPHAKSTRRARPRGATGSWSRLRPSLHHRFFVRFAWLCRPNKEMDTTVRSPTNWALPRKRKPSATISERLASRVPRSLASGRVRPAASQSSKPRVDNTPSPLVQVARWWPKATSGRPHPQVRELWGKEHDDDDARCGDRARTVYFWRKNGSANRGRRTTPVVGPRCDLNRAPFRFSQHGHHASGTVFLEGNFVLPTLAWRPDSSSESLGGDRGPSDTDLQVRGLRPTLASATSRCGGSRSQIKATCIFFQLAHLHPRKSTAAVQDRACNGSTWFPKKACVFVHTTERSPRFSGSKGSVDVVLAKHPLRPRSNSLAHASRQILLRAASRRTTLSKCVAQAVALWTK